MDLNAMKNQATQAADAAIANSKAAAKDGLQALKDKGAMAKEAATAEGAALKDKAEGFFDKLKDKSADLLREAADKLDTK